jgi:hypothetical protein
MSRLKRFLHLPAHDWGLLARALFYARADACHSPERIAWAAAGRLLPGSSCLRTVLGGPAGEGFIGLATIG